MATITLIPADEFCVHHQVETKFIHSLQDEGLIAVQVIDRKTFIPADELPRLEKMVHLHRDLDINIEGLASINHLLQKVEQLQDEIWLIKNRLRLYED